MGRAFDLEVFAVVVVKFLQGFDEQIVHWKPNRATPIGIAAEQASGGLRGLVGDAADMVIDLDFIGMIEMKPGQSANTVRREEFVFVEHTGQHALELLAIDEREEAAHAVRRSLRHFDVFGDIRMIVYEPLHAALEAGQAIHDFRLQGFHGEKGNKAHHRTNLEVVLAAIRQAENVVVKAVLVVPQSHAVYTDVVHGMSDVDEMLEEFASHVFVSHVFFCEFQSNGEHVEAVHAHPTGAVGLLEMAARGKRGGTVEDSDVIEPQEAALENVGAVGVLAIHPPGEIQKQVMKDFFKESAVGDATAA